MTTNHTAFAEINLLIRAAEAKYGSTDLSSTQFEELATQILDITKASLSPATLKRIWGYVSDTHTPRMATLDILSKYCGYDNFLDFCNHLPTGIESTFFSCEGLRSSNIVVGASFDIGWLPDRMLTLCYRGDNVFEVIEAENAKLTAGDRFVAVEFMTARPLYASKVMRGGRELPNYVAGAENGLSYVTAAL